MIQKFSRFVESNTGVYVYPRFIVSVLSLVAAIMLFGAAFFASRLYQESIKTIGPDSSAASAEYDARMRAGVGFPEITP